MTTLHKVSCIIFLYCSCLCIRQFSFALDTISTSQNISDGGSIASAGETFELGFFGVGNPQKRYLGIWYKNIPTFTPAWIANRNAPLDDTSGILKVTSKRGLILLNGNGSELWSSNMSVSVNNPIAQLLDNGNLVIRDPSGSSDSFLWQSFDYPADTLLAGMKLGRNRTSGFDRVIRSWKAVDDPSSGDFTYQIDPNGYPQLVLMQGSSIKYRAGSWNGVSFSGTSNLSPNPYYKYGFVLTDEEMYYHFELESKTVISRLVVSSNSVVQRYTWADGAKSWFLYLTAPIDNCDTYGLCGGSGSCNINNSPACECLKGFVPASPQQWNILDWSDGCVRKVALDCGSDIFVKYSGIRLPDTRQSWYNKSMNLKECELACKRNCSCTAYTNLYITNGGTGCLHWFGPLIDIREFEENAQDLYIRMAASESGLLDSTKKKEKVVLGSVLSSAILVLLGLGLALYVLLRKRKRKRLLMKGAVASNSAARVEYAEYQEEDLKLPLFDLATIAMATNDFSDANKIGEGGFGPVYRGILKNGQEIAVKKLASNSRQGIHEFKNEVLYVAKLQHRNLVKLLGCCIHEDYLLVYEYMANKSLDLFIFDEEKKKLLNWSTRFNIIKGIARGLLYLHQDSTLRIIHRDLKAGNILLDKDMNAKISDFGLARSFRANESRVNTTRVAGTHGYMSPEYAVDGIYSMKSDVFSFGVSLLEIVSGKRNRDFHYMDHDFNLLGHAWWLFIQERSIELLDEVIRNSNDEYEVLRSIHIGLLCVQRSPDDRPTMSTVVMMLGSEIHLPPPKEPGFYIERKPLKESSPLGQLQSVNEITMTSVSAR